MPGYTALNSAPAGLFGGNRDLGRERSDTLAFELQRQRRTWSAALSLFARKDDDLVDWTFLQGAPFARQANAVNIDVMGVELRYQQQWNLLATTIGYAYLDKEADYGAALVDASFYGLNFARHRLTAAFVIRPTDRLSLRFDNEIREQASHPLRSSKDHAFTASIAVDWRPDFVNGLTVLLIVDNVTNSNFEEFPGTPAAHRQLSLKLRYAW